jgi:hypothetical protein
MRFAVDPVVEKPIDGSLFPNLYLSSTETTCRTVDCLFPVGAGVSEGVFGLGVPGAVLAGVPAGLWSLDGGWESPLGPMEKVGCFG